MQKPAGAGFGDTKEPPGAVQEPNPTGRRGVGLADPRHPLEAREI